MAGHRALGILGAAGLILAIPPAVLAQPPAAPSFHDTIAAAWARLPQRRAFAARQGVAAAQYGAGGAFFPNAPYATGSYINDKALGSNYNYITTQAELGTPVWLPGEGTATQRAAQADAATVAAEADAAHLGLALEVLDLASQATLAANTRDVAARRLTAAQALATDLANRFHVGESSESNALAADAEAAGASVTLSLAEAQLASIRAALAAVTGVAVPPRLAATPAALATRPLVLAAAGSSPGMAALAAHPRIAAAERAVAAAQARARLVWIENRDSPQIGFQGINEKQPGSRWDTRFGVVFRLPFATQARNAPLRAAAEQVVTQAEVALALAQREVLAGIRQAEALLTGAARASTAAERAAGELDRRRGQIERAWHLGEMPLIEVIRANALAFDADLARDKARTELDAGRLRLLIARGLLP
jgi:cobalt-zinc-cadmium efflux system outer membrane protein